MSAGYLIRSGRVIDPYAQVDVQTDVFVSPEKIALSPSSVPNDAIRIEAKGCLVMPGLIDLHVHFREPGFCHKETRASGSRAALAGGVTGVVVMPNTLPSLDTPERVSEQMQGEAGPENVRIWVAAAATKGLKGREITDAPLLKQAGAVALSDDGKPVLDDSIMEAVLRACKKNDLVMMQHAEDTRISCHASMHEGEVSRKLGIEGQAKRAESDLVKRDVGLVRKIGARYHVLHASTSETIRLVQEAKAQKLPVTCEVTPHHLLLTHWACRGAEPNTKMNPPLRENTDRESVIEGIIRRTVDAVASDHAPHTAREKGGGFCSAPFGVVGLETAFSALYTLVHRGIIDAVRAVELMTAGPARVLKLLGQIGTWENNASADVCIFDPQKDWQVNFSTLKGKSTNSAFLGRRFRGRVTATFRKGVPVYRLAE